MRVLELTATSAGGSRHRRQKCLLEAESSKAKVPGACRAVMAARAMSAGVSKMKPETLMRTYLEEVVARGRLELIEELSNADMVDEANQAFGGPPGRAGLVAHVKGFRRHIGDLGVTVERIVAGDNSVVAWWSFTGRHTGPWLGRTPTGKPIRGSVFSFFDLVDGRINRYRLYLHAEFPESVVLDTSRPNLGLT